MKSQPRPQEILWPDQKMGWPFSVVQSRQGGQAFVPPKTCHWMQAAPGTGILVGGTSSCGQGQLLEGTQCEQSAPNTPTLQPGE